MYMRNAVLFIFICVAIISFNACDSGGKKKDSPPQNVSLEPSADYYKEDELFSPGQAVVVESETAFEKDEVVVAMDAAGREVNIIGLADGKGTFLIPLDADAGRYMLTFERRMLQSSVEIDVVEVAFPQNAQVYVSEFVLNLTTQLSNLLSNDDKLNTAELSDLLEEINQIDLESLSEEELSTLSKLLYVNSNALLLNSEVSAQLSDKCTKTLARFGVSFTVAGISIAAVAVTAKAIAVGGVANAGGGTVGAIGLGVLVGTALVSSYLAIENGAASTTDCLGSVQSSSIYSLSAQSQLSRLNKNGNKGIVYANPTNMPIVSFFDGETRPLIVSVTALPDLEVVRNITALKLMLVDLKELVSNIVASLQDDFDKIIAVLDGMLEPIEKDVSDQVSLGFSGNSLVECEGTSAAYQCGFLDDNRIYDVFESFTIVAKHPDSEVEFSAAARVLPRDEPVIDDQVFEVPVGPESRVVIEVIEDTTSPYYAFTKLMGYEIVSLPDYGTIVSDINASGEFDYRAEYSNPLPEDTTLSVRVWNRYGYSIAATITLKLVPADFKGDYSITETVLSDVRDTPVNGTKTVGEESFSYSVWCGDGTPTYNDMGQVVALPDNTGTVSNYGANLNFDAGNKSVTITYEDGAVDSGSYDPADGRFATTFTDTNINDQTQFTSQGTPVPFIFRTTSTTSVTGMFDFATKTVSATLEDKSNVVLNGSISVNCTQTNRWATQLVSPLLP